ncbi:MAG: glycoside hydrolase family 3 N-terminal domain-containing protein, partial [Ruthenibacterium sp.]
MKCTKEYRLRFTQQAQNIVDQMTLEEKIDLMGGNTSFDKMVSDAVCTQTEHYNHTPYPAGGNAAFDIPPMLFCDGPRGVVCGVGKSTCFPVTMLRGATFDADLERRIGQAIGREVLGHSGNLFAGVCVNLPYHPGWGRSQESYGEESFAVGKMGAALTTGVQDENVIACVKHFAFNSMEISRFKVNITCDRRTEREVFLPHFKDCIDAGAASVMSSYNLYKGVHCGQSDYLLRKVLKEEWDFDGFVMSDFAWGITDTIEAGNNGQDMEMCSTTYFGERLVQAVQNHLVSQKYIDEAALRIVRTLLAFKAAQDKHYTASVLGCKEHIALAREAAQKGITLIKNKGALPFDRRIVHKLAVIGKLADCSNLGDHGSSQVYPAGVVTLLQGLHNAAPDTQILYCADSDIAKAHKAALWADKVLFVVGFNYDDEGEYTSEDQDKNYTNATGGDRQDGLGLHPEDVELLTCCGDVNPHSVVVLIGGNTITMQQWEPKINAILQA